MQTLQKQIDSTRDLLSEKNQRVTKVSTEVNLMEEDIRVLNESTRQITQLADNLTAKAEIIRRGDTKVYSTII